MKNEGRIGWVRKDAYKTEWFVSAMSSMLGKTDVFIPHPNGQGYIDSAGFCWKTSSIVFKEFENEEEA